jgi:hypothetical protein
MILEREYWDAVVNTEVVQQARLLTLRRTLSKLDSQKKGSSVWFRLVGQTDRQTGLLTKYVTN